ncbi:MAG: L,D-transpeptidase family protein [Deferrisomatales bacterium]
MFRQVAGEIRRVVVAPGDTLIGLSGRHGVHWQALAERNRLADPDRIRVGRELEVDTRRIVPAALDAGVVVNIPEATLYLFERGTLAARYSVGLGRPSWQTPVGSFSVLFSQMDPTWHVPRSIQEEMAREGRVVMQKVPPGPDNPLGRYWIQLSRWGYGIHGTPFPISLGQFLSHGCIRVGDAGIEDLYRRVRRGTRVEIVYLPVKLAVTPTGEVWAEAHPDVYRRGFPGEAEVWAALEREGVSRRVDAQALRRVLGERLGLAQQVGTAGPRESARDPVGPARDAEAAGTDAAVWRCLDCPPGPSRRVTFQLQARVPLDLPNPFPIEVRDDAGRVVYRPQMVAQTIVHVRAGERRNFVWEVQDSDGQPLPAGSYFAAVRFYVPREGRAAAQRTLTLPLWVGN